MIHAETILARKGHRSLIALREDQTLAEAIQIMREGDFSQLPVMRGSEVVGSLHENRVLNLLLDDPSLRERQISRAMSDPFPFVLPSTRLDVISKLINRDNPAVMVKLEGQGLDIITQYDLIGVLAG
jgi:cystathionine beta-synthase